MWDGGKNFISSQGPIFTFKNSKRSFAVSLTNLIVCLLHRAAGWPLLSKTKF